MQPDGVSITKRFDNDVLININHQLKVFPIVNVSFFSHENRELQQMVNFLTILRYGIFASEIITLLTPSYGPRGADWVGFSSPSVCLSVCLFVRMQHISTRNSSGDEIAKRDLMI